MTDSYRSRIYEQYASRFHDAKGGFDAGAAERWGRAFDWYFRGWLPEDKSASILDIACGSGNLLHFFKQRGYRCLQGVDVSPEQVTLARLVIPEVHEGDVLNFLAVTSGTFDLITGLDIIEHLRKDEVLRFLDGCHSALRPGGRLILQTPNAESPWGCSLRFADFTHELGFQYNSLSRLLRLCGFNEVDGREQGPVPWGYSITSTLRWVSWQGIRLGLKLYNLAETGSSGSGVFTRVFTVSAIKPRV